LNSAPLGIKKESEVPQQGREEKKISIDATDIKTNLVLEVFLTCPRTCKSDVCRITLIKKKETF